MKGMPRSPYWLFMPWARWFIPLPLLVMYTRRNFDSVVLYQDRNYMLEWRRRYGNEKRGGSAAEEQE